jgi:hypothetical protein
MWWGTGFWCGALKEINRLSAPFLVLAPKHKTIKNKVIFYGQKTPPEITYFSVVKIN